MSPLICCCRVSRPIQKLEHVFIRVWLIHFSDFEWHATSLNCEDCEDCENSATKPVVDFFHIQRFQSSAGLLDLIVGLSADFG